MKIYIYVDEYYPYFGLGSPETWNEKIIEVTNKEGRWIVETMKQFEKVQKFLKEKYSG